MDDKSLSSQRVLLASILVALSPSGRGQYKKGFDKIAKKYGDYLKTQAKTYDDGIKGHKSAKQSANWTTLKELLKVKNKYRSYIKRIGYSQKATQYKEGKEKRHRELLMKYLVASLYTIAEAPRRNTYANMKIIKNKDYEDLSDADKESNNYLVVVSRNKKFFSFGDYKTKKSYGVKTFDAPKELNSVLNLWLNFNKWESGKTSFLLNSKGQAMTTNGLTKFLYKVFEPTGKKLSSNMIRHIWASEKSGESSEAYEKIKKNADAMGHSVKEHMETYVKPDKKKE